MSCTTLAKSVQGCINIPIIQGDNSDFTLTFGAEVDISDYEVVMDIKQTRNVGLAPIFRKVDGNGLTISGNVITIHFGSEMYDRNWQVLAYDILFTRKSDNWAEHWIIGKILITSSTTKP